jgi:hypothetical protein
MCLDNDWRTTHESSALTEGDAEWGVGGEGGRNCGLRRPGIEIQVGVGTERKNKQSF